MARVVNDSALAIGVSNSELGGCEIADWFEEERAHEIEWQKSANSNAERSLTWHEDTDCVRACR